MALRDQMDFEELDEERGPFDWYTQNSTLINTVIIIGLVVFIGYQLYTRYERGKIEGANAALANVEHAYDAAFNETDAAKRQKALSDLPPQAEQMAGSHSDMGVAQDAKLIAANATYYEAASMAPGPEAAEKFKQAREAYTKFIDTASGDRGRAIGQLGLANTIENQIFLTTGTQQQEALFREAETAYKQVQSLAPNTYLMAEAQLGLARLNSAFGTRLAAAKNEYEAVAQGRVLPEIDRKSAHETTITMPNGRELSPDEIQKIRSLEDLSYRKLAEENITRLGSLGTTATIASGSTSATLAAAK